MKQLIVFAISREWIKPEHLSNEDYLGWFQCDFEYEFTTVPNIGDVIDLEYVIKEEDKEVFNRELKTMLFKVVHRTLLPVDNSGIVSPVHLEVLPYIPSDIIAVQEPPPKGHLNHLKRNDYVIYNGGLNRKHLSEGNKYRLTGKPYTNKTPFSNVSYSLVNIVDDSGDRLRLKQEFFKEINH